MDVFRHFGLGEPKYGDLTKYGDLADFGGLDDSGRLDTFGHFGLGELKCGDISRSNIKMFPDFRQPFLSTQNHANFKM